ncbi:MAG: 2-amino-4-hydroxy-6-hydroxymethyldihydropteridine diphosphokinase [Odoribacter sp.]|nr:2-amino-4-hydroxy-6-hydroxymethyldihydropteridine diphosphokinase [Odoribacter sp.]
MNHICYLCIGSNMPPRLRRLDDAIEALKKVGDIDAVSETIESDDDRCIGPQYLNIVVRLVTQLTPKQLHESLRDTERLLGRSPESKERGIMPIDIDLVIYDGSIVSEYDYSRPYFTACYRQLTYLQ